MRARFTVAVCNYEKSGQVVSDLFPDFGSGDPITSYMFYVFKDLPSLEHIMREVGDGNRAECGIGGSKVSSRTAGKYLPKREVKRPGSTEDAVMEVDRSISNPVGIKLTLSDGTEQNTERSLQ